MSALTKKQLAHLLKLVDKRHIQIIRDIARERASAAGQHEAAVATNTYDEGHEAAASTEAALNRAQLARDVEELQDIEAAHARIHAGSYGVCINCGGDIHYQRLLAWPTAKRCYDCQCTYELRRHRAGVTG